MAASSTPLGYQCEFVDSVPEDFYCKQCSLVARRLTITSCCGESYCNGCIHSTQQDNKPCPGCGQESFETFQQVRYQRKILSLREHCSVKERVCGWCGPLEHLDAHLDPDTGDCEYTDITCPLECHKKISKKNLKHHLANECVKRDYMCPYCAFKATYDVVTDVHWPECKYYPLACPNRCGVTCERPTMEEDHMKICPLQEVECEFRHIGCAEKFRREDEEEHMREKAQTHLTMMAATSVRVQRELQTQLQEQERRLEGEFRTELQEQERRLEGELQEQERRLEGEFRTQLQEQEKRFSAHELEFRTKLQEQEKRFDVKLEDLVKEFEEKLKTQEVKLQEQNSIFEGFQKSVKTEHEELNGLSWKFTMGNFSTKKTNRMMKLFSMGCWKSPPMYTHPGGYKFTIGIYPNGFGVYEDKGVNIELIGMKGEYDDQLQWPFTAKFTLELINHFENGENKTCTITQTWRKPSIDHVSATKYHLIFHTELSHNPTTQTHFLKDDTLHFRLLLQYL